MSAARVFRGSSHLYTEIAKRGLETLGMKLMPYGDQNGVGVSLRLVATTTANDFAPFTHLPTRGLCKFQYTDNDQVVKGYRLVNVSFPLISPMVPPHQLGQVGDNLGIWEVIAEWIAEQAKSDGFELCVEDFTKLVRQQIVPELTNEEIQNVKLTLEFPELKPTPQHQHKQQSFGGEEFDPDEGESEGSEYDADN